MLAILALIAALTGCSRAKTFDAVQIAERSDVRVLLSPMTAVPVLSAADEAVVFDRWIAGVRWSRAVAFAGAAAREATSSAQVVARAVVSVSSVGLGACDGDLPPCFVKARESGGNYGALSPAGYCDQPPDYQCHGAWQMGSVTARDAVIAIGHDEYADVPPEQWPPAIQDDAARQILRVQGCGAWSC